jgi:hypothetical protein
MKSLLARTFFASFLLVAAAAHAAGPPRFYPAANAPLGAEPLLSQVDGALPQDSPQPTLRFPLPDATTRLATSDEFFAAFEAALTADPANAAGLVLGAARVVRISDGSRRERPVAVPIDSLLISAGNVAAVASHLGEIHDALIAEYPQEIVNITGGVLREAARNGATAADLGVVARAAMRAIFKAFPLADAPVHSVALTSIAASITDDLAAAHKGALAAGILTGLIRGVRDAGLEELLLDEVVRGAMASLNFTTSVTLTDLAAAAFAEVTPTRSHAAQLGAALVLGVPFILAAPGDADAVVAAGSSAWPAFANVITITARHASLIRFIALSRIEPETRSRINAEGNALSDAIVFSAIMARPSEAAKILRVGFELTFGEGITPPATPFLDWLKMALAGDPKSAPKLLPVVLDSGDEFQLFSGAVTHADAVAAILLSAQPVRLQESFDAIVALIRAGKASAIEVLTRVGTLSGALAGSYRPLDAAALVPPLFSASPTDRDTILTDAVLGVADPRLRAAITAAAIVADPLNAGHYGTIAAAADSSTADDASIGASAAAAETFFDLQFAPASQIAAAVKTLLATRPGRGFEVALGGVRAAPKQSVPILAALLAADATFTLDDALSFGPDHAASLRLASQIAADEVADAQDPGTTLAALFDRVEIAVLAHRIEILNLTNAAVLAAPRYAHHTLHAAAFRYPSVALKIVQTGFGALDLDAPGDAPARAAALTAGVVNGIRESSTGTAEIERLKLAIGAAVKASIDLRGPAVATSNGTPNGSRQRTRNGPAAVVAGFVSQLVQPGDTSLKAASVLKAAAKKAPTHALSIAQAAAQTAVSVAGASSSAFKLTGIVNNVAIANPGFTFSQITRAAQFGKARGLAAELGAGAPGLLGYQHHSGTTDPLPSLEGL